MGYAKVSIDDVDPHRLDDPERTILPIGVELRPAELRPSVWEYDAGETSNRHHQREQEELYAPLSGRFEFEIGEGEASELVEVESGDYLVVDPHTVRKLTATEAGRILVVGAPSVKDDGVVVD